MPAPAKSIDTRKIADQLTESGVPVEQAKAHASVIAEAIQMHSAQLQEILATKEELREVRAAVAALDAKIDTKVLELNAKIDMVKMELYAMIEASAEKVRQDLRRDMRRYFILFVLPLAFLQAATLAGLMLGVFN